MAGLRLVADKEPSNVVHIDGGRRYVGLTEAAERTTLSRSYVHQLVMSGDIPGWRVGRRILIAVDDLDAFVRPVPA